MLHDLWLVITRKLSSKQIADLLWHLEIARHNYEVASKRANEAVRLYNEGEIARKQSSDALGNAVIKQMLGDK